MTAARAQIHKVITDLKSKLLAHALRIPAFATNGDKIEQITSALAEANLNDLKEADNSIKTFTVAIKGLTDQDQPVVDDITAAITELEVTRTNIQSAYKNDPMKSLQKHLPTFIFHSTTTDQIPNAVNVADFLTDADGTSKGMSNLCRAAGLPMQKIRELAQTSDTQQRETYEDHYKGTISGGLNEFWKSSPHLSVDCSSGLQG